MKLAQLQQLSTKELKQLAAKEGVTPPGDKRARITWLEALEKHFEEKEILSYQPKHYQLKLTKDGQCFYRRRGYSDSWERSNLTWLQLHRRCMELDQTIDEARLAFAVDLFRNECVRVRQRTRAP